jgi:asparagine synthase (glutamine-hydrolysing)
MCGIAGFQGTGTLADAERMIARIAYRGPDRQLATMIGATGLAHARLSIIDLSREADQPMRDATGRYTIVFNGEIYNHATLRRALEREGAYTFRTNSDTEVLLALYARHGADMLPMLNGMFAFAMHDAHDGSLFLARDRMGKKPLHYAEAGGTFVFGSELKAVTAHPAVGTRLDLHGLHQYLTFEYVPGPRSIIEGVRKLPPGQWIKVRKGRVCASGCYWRVTNARIAPTPVEAMEGLDRRLRDATERRLMSDVPLGVFLSGGLDSSAVAYYARSASSTRISTFSIAFDDPSYDESGYATLVADHLGTDHHVHTLTPQDSLDLLPPLYSRLDEPFADASLIPTHLLSRFARGSVTVALGGDGSDELFAGYPTFIADRFRTPFHLLPKSLIRGLQALVSLLPRSDRNISLDLKVKQFLRGFEERRRDVHTLWLGSFTPREKQQLLTPAVHEALRGGTGLEPLDDVRSASPWPEGSLDDTIFAYLRTYLLDDILFKVDRASMYTSLEVRAPFMDVEVVEYVNSLPGKYKRRGMTGKWLLKQVMRDKLPDAVIDRPKKGFGIPLSEWLRGPLRPVCEELLSPDALRQEGLFDPAFVERLKQEHFERRANHRKVLWTLMVFRAWATGRPG